MSTNTSGLLVTFKDDIDDETADELARLLRFIKGVIDVQPVPQNIDQTLGQMRADSEWRTKLVVMLREVTKR